MGYGKSLTAGSLDSESKLEALLGSINVIISSEIDSEAKIEALAGAINLLVSTELDTEAELESLIGSVNVILASEINSEAKVEAIMGVAMATEAEATSAASSAVGTHEGTYAHGDIATNTSARHTQGTDLGLDTGGANAVTAAQAKAASDHVTASGASHGDVATNTAAIGGMTLIDTTDARLSDARTPSAHAASHQNAGDPLSNVVASGIDTTDRTTTTGSIVEISGCEMTFTALAKTYRLIYTGMHNIASVGPATMMVYYQIDAGGWVEFIRHATVVAGAAATISANIPLALSAGSRTIKLGFDPDAGTMHTEGDVIATHSAVMQ